MLMNSKEHNIKLSDASSAESINSRSFSNRRCVYRPTGERFARDQSKSLRPISTNSANVPTLLAVLEQRIFIAVTEKQVTTR